MTKRHVLLAVALACAAAGNSAAAEPKVRLYTLDCGHLDLEDMGAFNQARAGQRGEMAVSCYLVRDGNRWLLWDTGLGDGLAPFPHGKHILGGQWTVRRTLVSQLADLGLTPADIAFVGLSHLHIDHTGNLGLFTRSKVLIGARDLSWARRGAAATSRATAAALSRGHVRLAGDDVDVFGDGRVRMFATPGHTPGHHSLLVRLPKAGAVLLSGDLYHSRENLEKGIVPRINTSRIDTLASFARFKHMALRYHARIIVQHAPEDFAALPQFPGFLE